MPFAARTATARTQSISKVARILAQGLGALALLSTLGGMAQATPLYSNGPVVDASNKSVIASNFNTYGWTVSTGYSMADDFKVATGQRWMVDSLDFYAYIPGALAFPFTSATWSIVAGDVNTGTVVASGVSGVANGGIVGYRTTSTSPSDTQRAIYLASADVSDFELDSGSYWLRWSLATTSGIAYQPPTADGAVGNAMQAPDGARFADATDSTTGMVPTLPFQINGSRVDGAEVPEPASLALIVAGLCAGGVLRRKRA